MLHISEVLNAVRTTKPEILKRSTAEPYVLHEAIEFILAKYTFNEAEKTLLEMASASASLYRASIVEHRKYEMQTNLKNDLK